MTETAQDCGQEDDLTGATGVGTDQWFHTRLSTDGGWGG